MGALTIIASISSIVFTVLAAVGWLVFIGGFGAFNTGTRFFETANQLSPERREVEFLLYNSHYIAAVFSPLLFIVLIIMSVMMMAIKYKWAPYLTAIMSVPILILVAFVMISGGAALQTSSMLITLNRLNITPTGLGIPEGIHEFTSNIGAMFAEMFLEVLFLTGALISLFFGTILAAAEQKMAA